jgi:hypothetical protein
MRANTHSIVVGKQPATKDGVGPRLLLALAMLALLQGCATGSPRASLTSGFGLHSRPSVSLHGSGSGLSAATPVLTEAQGGAGGFSSEAEALLAPFLACTSPGEFIRLQDTVDMPRLVEKLDDWHAVRLGALGPVREDAAPLLNSKRVSFLSGLRFADVLVIEQQPPNGRPPRVETFSFKSRDLSGLKGKALGAQMKADAKEALGYYGETLDIRRPSLKHLIHGGSEVPVPRVRLIYEGGALKTKDVTKLKAAVDETKTAVPGVEVLFQ